MNATAPKDRRPTLLLVDDEPTNLQVLRGILQADYRLLYAQGPNATGGAREYFKNGVMTEGFAGIAWPADYGASGVMTFIVNQDGVVFQKDLGEETEAAANAIQKFDPDATWIAIVPPAVNSAAPAAEAVPPAT